MMIPRPQYHDLSDAVRALAALSGPFRPLDLLRRAAMAAGYDATVLDDQVLVAEVLSSLRADCVTQSDKGGALWVMRPAARHKLLDPIPGSARSAADPDADQTPVQEALAGRGAFAPAAIDRLIEQRTAPDQLQDVIITLERTGPAAPAHNRIVALRGALNTARQNQRNDATLKAGFFGREAELARIARWISAPQSTPPLRSLHLSGLPGIGKSFLLERAIQMARLDQAPVIVRLDFDRAALQMLDTYALFEEISRQIGDGLPFAAAELRALRLESAEELAAMSGALKRRAVPHRLIAAMTGALMQAGCTLLIVLDTLEVLRSRGETYVMTLFDQLDLLLGPGMGQVSILSAGRGDALDPVPERVSDHLVLAGLEPRAARQLLAARNIDPAHWPQILPIARGNPLLILLAAKAAESGSLDPAKVPQGQSDTVVAGYLYRAILSRVPERLRRIASEGLILRRINADALVEVVAPALGLTIRPAEAKAMLTDLSAEHWLVENADGWLRHRSDVRSAFLELMYQDNSDSAAEIDRRAAAWFDGIDPLSALYHRLQLTRTGAALPPVVPELAALFTEAMLDDLPARARDAVLQTSGQRSGYARIGSTPPVSPQAPSRAPSRASSRSRPREAAPDKSRWWLHYDPSAGELALLDLPVRQDHPDPDPRALRDLELMLEAGELREAGFVLAHGFPTPVRVDGMAGLLMLAHQWQAGRWSAVRQVFDRLPGASLDDAMARSPQLLGRILLEIWAEFRFDALVARLDAPDFLSQVRSILRQSGRIGLAGGALEFACLSARAADITAPEFDAARAALCPHLDAGQTDAARDAVARADRLRRRLGLLLGPYEPEATSALHHAQAIAPLNPYAGVLQTVVQGALETGASPLLDYLSNLRRHLPTLAEHFTPTLEGVTALSGRLGSAPFDVAEALSVMGLGAEWAEGYAFHHPVPDIPTLARSAERWRLATLGVWRYGTRAPQGWATGTPDADPASLALARRIARGADPEATAHALIWLWSDPSGAGTHGRQAQRRLTARYDAARQAARAAPAPLQAALASLSRADVTAVIAAPLAVLAASQIAPATALHPPAQTSSPFNKEPPP